MPHPSWQMIEDTREPEDMSIQKDSQDSQDSKVDDCSVCGKYDILDDWLCPICQEELSAVENMIEKARTPELVKALKYEYSRFDRWID